MEDQELLKYAIEHDMISMSYIKDKYEMDKRKKYLEKHPYAVWEGRNGFWYTHFPLKGGGRCSNPRCLTQKSRRNGLKSRFLGLWNFGKSQKVTNRVTKQEKKQKEETLLCMTKFDIGNVRTAGDPADFLFLFCLKFKRELFHTPPLYEVEK